MGAHEQNLDNRLECVAIRVTSKDKYLKRERGDLTINEKQARTERAAGTVIVPGRIKYKIPITQRKAAFNALIIFEIVMIFGVAMSDDMTGLHEDRMEATNGEQEGNHTWQGEGNTKEKYASAISSVHFYERGGI